MQTGTRWTGITWFSGSPFTFLNTRINRFWFTFNRILARSSWSSQVGNGLIVQSQTRYFSTAGWFTDSDYSGLFSDSYCSGTLQRTLPSGYRSKEIMAPNNGDHTSCPNDYTSYRGWSYGPGRLPPRFGKPGTRPGRNGRTVKYTPTYVGFLSSHHATTHRTGHGTGTIKVRTGRTDSTVYVVKKKVIGYSGRVVPDLPRIVERNTPKRSGWISPGKQHSTG